MNARSGRSDGFLRGFFAAGLCGYVLLDVGLKLFGEPGILGLDEIGKVGEGFDVFVERAGFLQLIDGEHHLVKRADLLRAYMAALSLLG